MSYLIHGVQMPSHLPFEAEITNLYGENTGRDEAGLNRLDLIRSGVRKYQIMHMQMTATERAKIKGALNPRGFNVTIDGATFSAYAGGIKETVNPSGNRWDISFSIVEN